MCRLLYICGMASMMSEEGTETVTAFVVNVVSTQHLATEHRDRALLAMCWVVGTGGKCDPPAQVHAPGAVRGAVAMQHVRLSG